MSKAGRFMGHGMAVFFFLLGAAFFVLGMSERFTSSLEENSNCQSGDCDGGVRTTFLILGVSFMGTAGLLAFLTEYSIRKTTSIIGQVQDFAATGSTAGLEEVADFLKPFGISIDPATQANVNAAQQTIDLRNQRIGEVPTDPAGLSAYLKSVGVAIDESVLRNATVVHDSRASRLGAGSPAQTAPQAAGDETRPETATIVRKRDRGETSGNQRLIEFELEVRPVGKVPYRVQVASLVRESLAALLVEGSTLNVRVDSHDENAVTIDWSEN
jgi:hypothetical protein